MNPTTNDKANITKSESKRHFGSKKLWIGGGAAALLVAVIVSLVFISLHSGVLYFGFKSPDQEVILKASDQQFILRTVVCDDVIEQYNSIFIPLDDAGWEFFDQLINDIKSKTGYEEDPTCQSIQYFYSWQKQDIDGMKKALNALKELRKRGLFVDNMLRNNLDITTMDAIITLGIDHD